MAYRIDGKRVSKPWYRVLTRARQDGIDFRVNSGRRTMREQWALFRQNMIRPGVPKPGRPLTAIPSPTAPHIRVGRADHALDVDTEQGDGEQALQNYLSRKGVRTSNPVPGEPWHLEANRSDLLRRYRLLERGIRLRRRRRTHA